MGLIEMTTTPLVNWINGLLTNTSGTFYQQNQELITLKDYTNIAAILNTPQTITNPITSAPNIPKPLALTDIYAAINPADAMAIFGKVNDTFLQLLQEYLAANDRIHAANMLTIASQIISSQSVTNIQALLAETIPDPSWTATIQQSLAVQNGYDSVSSLDVQNAFNLSQ